MFVVDKKICDINYMKPLLQIAKYLSLSPCNFDRHLMTFQKTSRNPLNVKETYVVTLCSILLGSNICLQYQKYANIYPNLQTSLAIVDAITTTCLLLVNLTAIASLNFWNKRSYEQLMLVFEKTDAALNRFNVILKSKPRTFYVELSIELSLLTLMVIYDNYFWFNAVGFPIYLTRLMENFQRFHFYIFFILIRYFIVSTQQRFSCLNFLINKTVLSYVHMEATKSSNDVKGIQISTHSRLKTLSKLFVSLSENVGLFNKIFGWSILISITYIISSILLAIDYLLTLLHTRDGEVVVIDWFRKNLIAIRILWSLFAFGMCVILARSADNVIKQVRYTTMICFKLAQKFDDRNSEEEKLRENLISLAQQASCRCPRFTAAGFFDIDYTMLFTLLNMFTSYLIVLIQFLK